MPGGSRGLFSRVGAAALLIAAATGGWTQAGATAPADSPAAAPRSFVGAQWALRAIRAKRLQARWHAPLANVVVATIDSGVALRHPDLRRSLWRNPLPTPAPLSGGVVPAGAVGWDLLGVDPQPDDTVGHGTTVAGLIAAQIGDGGVDGVAPNARLMAMKACWRPLGGELTCSDDSSAAAIDWAAAHGARVIHLSWTLGGGPMVAGAVASHPGVLFVANAGNAAGNSVDSTRVNCTIPSANLICVAGSARGGGPSPCTSVGPVSVDVAAPGAGIATTALGGRYLLNSPCAVSFAGPHVSGLAAVLLGAVPSAGPLAVKQAILDGARPDPGFAGKTVTGGIIDVPRSLGLLRQRRGSAP